MIAKKTSNEELASKLTAELKYLRGLVREAGEGFILRKEGEIETLLGYLAGMPASKIKEVAPKWLRETRDLKLKPAKGRLKDLKHIDALLEGMLDNAVEMQQPAKVKGKKSGSNSTEPMPAGEPVP